MFRWEGRWAIFGRKVRNENRDSHYTADDYIPTPKSI